MNIEGVRFTVVGAGRSGLAAAEAQHEKRADELVAEHLDGDTRDEESRASHRQLRAAQCSNCTAIGTRALLRYAPIDDPRERSAAEGCAEVLHDRVAALLSARVKPARPRPPPAPPRPPPVTTLVPACATTASAFCTRLTVRHSSSTSLPQLGSW